MKRTLNLFDMIMINLGAIIGAGIFAIIGISISKAGPSVVISILISATIALLTGISFSEIALYVSKEGGVYEFAKEALSPFAGFMGGWAWLMGSTVAISAMLLSLGSYLDSLLGITLPIAYFAIASLAIFAIINIRGISNSAKTIRWLVFMNIAVLAIFVIVGLFFFKASNLQPFTPNGFYGVAAGSAIIFFAFTGFSRVTTIAEEVKNPKKNMPKAIIISIIVSTLLYLVVAIVAVGMLNSRALGSSASPLAAAAAIVNNRLFDIIIAIGGISATAGVSFTGILGTSRVFFAMGRDGEFPKGLSVIDRFNTPINAILLVSLLVLVTLLFIKFSDTVELSNAGVLIAYAIINLAALNMSLRRRKSKKSKNKHLSDSKYFPIIPSLGFLSILAMLSYLGMTTLYIMVGVLALGIIYYISRNAKRRSAGKQLNAAVPAHSAVREFGSRA
ncbi:MAG: APC family permease [Candidatus Micrarchaeaceae archaeon]